MKTGSSPAARRRRFNPISSSASALNESGRYEDRWVTLEFDPESPCVWTKGLTRIDCPVRHGEGRFVVEDEIVLDHGRGPPIDGALRNTRKPEGRREPMHSPLSSRRMDRRATSRVYATPLAWCSASCPTPKPSTRSGFTQTTPVTLPRGRSQRAGGGAQPWRMGGRRTAHLPQRGEHIRARSG